MKTILLKLAGPLQSWGTGSNFETRHTDLHPSKSAIIGLVAACLGYRRYEDDKIQKLNELDFAVRIDEQGMILRDFHIAAKYKRNGNFDQNYVTNRYYLQDAVFVVGLSHEDENYLSEIYEALKAPYFQPFMGRRSLPLNADFLIGLKNGSIIENLNDLPRQAKKGSSTHKSDLSIYGDAHLFESRHKRMRQDRVISFNQEERKFGFRAEARGTIVIKEEHDVFNEIGGDHVSVEG